MNTFTNVLLKGTYHFFYMPVWWYSKGFLRFTKSLWESLVDYSAVLGVGIWIKTLFVPLYGQSDIAGRILSFFMRVANIIVRGIGLLFVVLLHLLIAFGWLALPVLIFYQIIVH